MLNRLRLVRTKLPPVRNYTHFTSNKVDTVLSSFIVPFSLQNPVVTQPNLVHNLQIVRFKSKNKGKTKRQDVSDSESEKESDMETELVDKNTKIMKISVTSLRLDGILKNALGIARNKVEQMFYESKIRVNGEKVLKKSVSVEEGDEIDVIKGAHQSNPDMIVVARVEILGATAEEDAIVLKIRRYKSLVIENYKDKWQGTGS